MIEPDRLISAVSGRERDEQLDRAIRPLKLADYIGQPSVREQMGCSSMPRAAARRRSTIR